MLRPNAPFRPPMSDPKPNTPFAERLISAADDAAMAQVVRDVMTEFQCTAEGFAIHDPELGSMTAAYAAERHAFYVIEHGGEVVGGAGYAPLEGGDGTVAELRKMYFLPQARGQGIAGNLLSTLLHGMRDDGFTACYLETTSWMTGAQKLYRSKGFTPLSGPMGQTGHHACDTFFSKNLAPDCADTTGA